MDSLKRRPSAVPPKAPEQITQKSQIPQYPKRVELYISQEETMRGLAVKKMPKKKKWLRKLLWTLLLLIILFSISYISFFLWKTYAVTKKMSAASVKQTTFSQDMKTMVAPIVPSDEKHVLQGENEGRINILLLGAAGENKPGGNLTDTVMIMSINTEDKKIALLSLPRDFYVPIPDSNTFTKINSLYKIGMNEDKGADLTKQAVEKVTNLKINYYVTVDFDAFEKIIDNIGGVNIISERDIYDPRYPGPNYSYQTFSLSKGAHLLDGKTALMYVRERHDDPQGDFGRAKRQQQVIQAVKNKFFSVATLFNAVAMSNVLDTLGENVKTDMSFDDIDQFIKLSKTLDTQNISNVVVDAWKPDSLLKVSHVVVGNVQAFILVPRVGNYSEIQDLAKNIFDQSEIKKRRDAIASEDASIGILNKSGSAALGVKIKKLLSEKLEMKEVQSLSSETTGSDAEISTVSTVSTNSAGEGKIFTLDELIKKLPATLDSQKTDGENDITITLGKDLLDIYKYEEDSIDDFNKAQDSNQEIPNF